MFFRLSLQTSSVFLSRSSTTYYNIHRSLHPKMPAHVCSFSSVNSLYEVLVRTGIEPLNLLLPV